MKKRNSIGKIIKNSILLFGILLVICTFLWIFICPGNFSVWLVLALIDLVVSIFLAYNFNGMVSDYLDKKGIKRLNKLLASEKDDIKAEILQAKIDYIENGGNSADTEEDINFGVLVDCFEDCLKMDNISIVNEKRENEATREWAKVIVDSKKIEWKVISNPFGIEPHRVPCIPVSHNNQLVLFPTFFVQCTNISDCSKMKFSAHRYKEMQAKYYDTRMSYSDDDYPRDSEIIDYTWEHVNNDGSKDLRFCNNEQIPICKLGSMDLLIPDGTFSYITSQTELLSLFVEALRQLINNPNSATIKKTESSPKKSDLPNISPENFANIVESIKNIYSILRSMCLNVDVIKHVRKLCGEVFDEGTNEELIYTFALFDLIYGHILMQHDYINDERYSIGLIELSSFEEHSESCKYKSQIYYDLSKEIKEQSGNLQEMVNEDTEMEYCLSKFISGFNTELHETYKIALYRYFSYASKLDGVVTDAEKKFLSEFLTDNKDEKKTLPPRLTLDELVGMHSVKEEIKTLTNFVKVQKMRAEQGMKTTNVSYHLVFTGNPGTGKTTVARIVADIYRELGILKKGHLVETDRSGLVAEYVGQTAVKTNKIIDSALDGVLFIDEAYSLNGGTSNDYGAEAIATLLKRMEDDRDRLVVIIAGYTDEIGKFIESNPGLKSRFNRYINFQDYTVDELWQIFESYLKKNEYCISEEAKVKLYGYIRHAVSRKDKTFGNARFVRNVFEKVIESQANRLASCSNVSKELLSQIIVEDVHIEE